MADNLSNTCEGSSGTTISISNSSGPNQFDVVNLSGTGAGSAWDNAHAHAGSTSWKITLAAGVACLAYVDWTTSITPTPVANAYARFYLYITALPTATSTRLCGFVGSTVSQGALQLMPTGVLRMASNTSQLTSTTATVPLNAWCRIEFEGTGNTGTACTLATRLFSGANLETTTPDTGGSISASAQVTTALVSDVRIGCTTTTETSAWSSWWDDIAFSDTATPGPTSTSATVTMGSALSVPAAFPASQLMSLTSVAYAASQDIAGAGTGSWASPGNATGTPDNSWATWTAP